MKKTVASFICLSFLLLLSFILSTYEYNEVHDQYQQVYDNVSKKIGHPEVSKNQTVSNIAVQNATIATKENVTEVDHTKA